jgi:hypothetical protein
MGCQADSGVAERFQVCDAIIDLRFTNSSSVQHPRFDDRTQVKTLT